MENHPIPQDVTGFKFKLIGSITVKQFLYLLFSGLLAYTCFLLGLPFFVKFLIALIPICLGTALAFLPVDGRPMDAMILNYLKAVPSENQYIYRKRGSFVLDFSYAEHHKKTIKPNSKPQQSTAQDLKKIMLLNQFGHNGLKDDQEELDFIKKIKSFFDEAAMEEKEEGEQSSGGAVKNSPNINSRTPLRVDENKEEQPVEAETKQEASKQEVDKANADQRQRERVEQKVIEQAKEQRAKEALAALDKKPSIKTIGPEGALKAGFPMLPDIPNIILGIVKDPRDKILQNILVEVLDKNDVPVRAFKTNTLGQFASATPLSNGIYKIFFEDPSGKHEFEAVEINLTGEIFYPLEVTSVDEREKLRRELFKN
ncbi:hypothetical protein C4577_07830 [Candidatus Parcubacteria bacterium]|nr:MAG: hypothetical protein C4577_07830 [Candidatus Parcubacteria bacterium]